MSNIRILILAHAPLAGALLQCALHVFPDSQDYLDIVDVQASAEPEDVAQQARQLVHHAFQRAAARQAGGARSVLVLTDIFGATPSNVARMLASYLAADDVQARIVTGINVPMLMRAITYRDQPLADLVERVVSGGTSGVMALPDIAPQHKVQQPYYHDSRDHDHHQ